MDPIPGFPFFPVEFDKQAKTSDDAQVTALQKALDAGAVTDLIVLSHGWNNDMQEAKELYQELLTNMGKWLDKGTFPALKDRKFAVLGVLWPSKKFADKDLIPSGAAGVKNTVETDELRAQLKNLRGGFDAADGDAKLAALQALLPKLEDSDKACREFVETCRSLVKTRSSDKEAESSSFFTGLDALEVFKRFEQPTSFVANVPAQASDIGGAQGLGDAQGGAAGLGDFFSGVISSARNTLNYTTYYQMKERAGLVGSKGVNPLLRDIRKKHPNLRIHVVGHSFGGRLVAAIVAGEDISKILNVSSMSLLQAAFSHHAFSSDFDGKGSHGFFLRVIQNAAISGPVAITHTENDKAVGVAYPLASLLAGQNASGIGDKNSPYGGLGRNGAQKSQATELQMKKDSTTYALQKGKLHNLLADTCVSNHGDVRNPSVAAVVLSAIAAA